MPYLSLVRPLLLGLVMFLPLAGPALAQSEAHYRAFWVDTFNTPLNNHSNVVAIVNNAKAARANAIFIQMRRRGDAFYRNALEPPPDFVPIEAGFDPLSDLITEAHANGIEVHAFVVVGSIWNKSPLNPPSSTTGPPLDPNHVFNRHGGFDSTTGTVKGGPNNWLTRTLLPDQNDGTGAPLISLGGYRLGSLFFMDAGHPDAAAYTVEVLTHLVRHYDIDGLHLDYIRYPELSISGQTPSTGTNIGYNDTSVARFQRRYGIAAGSAPPAPNDAQWSNWRRDQVTNLVRRIYLNAIAIKPQIKLSAALIAFGNGPTTEASWNSAEAYWRVYQDWRAWTEEGILDIVAPMLYKTEHSSTGRAAYDQWLEWTKNHAYNRSVLVGQGSFLNSIEGTLRQVRRALAPSSTGQKASGVIFFSMAVSNEAVTANPFSVPTAGQNTPRRSFAEFAAGLTTGRALDGTTPYEDTAANPTPVFQTAVPIPTLSWKTKPQVGHLMGVIKEPSGAAVDTGDVVISRIEDGSAVAAGRTTVTTATDGGGFFGGVDLAPGHYRVTVTPPGQAPFLSGCPVKVAVGQVATFNLTTDRELPTASIAADQVELRNSTLPVDITLTGTATDETTGITSIQFRVIDEYGRTEPAIEAVAGAGVKNLTWARTVRLDPVRHIQDPDGRRYTIEAIITDGACNTRTVSVVVLGDALRPAPNITRVNPTSVTAGNQAFSLTITGKNFLKGAVVHWNGAPRKTTYVRSNKLRASISAADLATAGTVTITVSNPAPGGGTSNVRAFRILAP